MAVSGEIEGKHIAPGLFPGEEARVKPQTTPVASMMTSRHRNAMRASGQCASCGGE